MLSEIHGLIQKANFRFLAVVRMKPLFYSWLLIVAFDVADQNLIMHFDTESSCLRAQYEAWEAGGALVMPCRETGDPFVKADSDE